MKKSQSKTFDEWTNERIEIENHTLLQQQLQKEEQLRAIRRSLPKIVDLMFYVHDDDETCRKFKKKL